MYNPSYVSGLTVKDLKDLLDKCPDDLPVYIAFYVNREQIMALQPDIIAFDSPPLSEIPRGFFIKGPRPDTEKWEDCISKTKMVGLD